ncbi:MULTISPECIES: universal stress protein [Olivibacter]|uniref:Universal stress protein n=2 Tax=Olivibacter TaxID=376469 RepID=A0ABV6HPR2_9SPHI|nr:MULTISPECIES: universal stress protein [Olivibacter]MCL4642248.1 universal stress protein [Olivibacter sp. UJ_SKK_5.1]MDM8176042.1 universal stress protein [Olivibacter sp. 47]MDX3917398.1 universal stress protein [Pseudosphingobacterium sp.]
MKNILLMIDVANKKDNVLQYALKLAQSLKSNMILSCIIDDRTANYAQAFSELEKIKEDLKGHWVATDFKPVITSLVERGVFAETMFNLVKDLHIELILMGAADGKNTTGFLFGKKVREIVDKINCPILIIPEQVVFEGLKNILYVTDLRYTDFKIVMELAKLSEPLHVKLSMLHVCAEGLPDLTEDVIESLFTETISSRVKQRIRIFNAGKHGHAETIINRLMTSEDQGMLAIAHRKHHFFAHLFSDKPAEGAEVYKRVPILLMPVA